LIFVSGRIKNFTALSCINCFSKTADIAHLPFKPRFSLINQCYDPVIYRNENIFYFIPLAGGGGGRKKK
jgi:hypothetical protein|tara:strand:- start:640 stop:846 length:207 start_codon:yes stop_codon:yes gene_type:complete